MPAPSSATLTVPEDAATGADADDQGTGFVLSPKVSVEELLQKDSDDAAMARYKASLLGAAGGGAAGSTDGHPRARFPSDPRIVVLDSLRIETDEERPPIVVDLNDRALKSKPHVLREGAQFSVVLGFYVQHDLVTGLRWTSSVYKYGVCVDKVSEMLGSFAPSNRLITHRLPEEEAPAGILARGSFTAKAKLTDDDGRTHAEFEYAFGESEGWEWKQSMQLRLVASFGRAPAAPRGAFCDGSALDAIVARLSPASFASVFSSCVDLLHCCLDVSDIKKHW